MAGLLAEMAEASASADEPSLSVSVSVPMPVPDLAPDAVELPALPSESSFHYSGIPTDASSNNASFISTPPTTVADAASIASEPSKPDITATLPTLDEPQATLEPTERIEDTVEAATDHVPESEQQTPKPSASEESPTPRRTRSSRASARAPVYNIFKLSGTDVHGKRRANGDIVQGKRRRTISGDIVANDAGANPSMDSVVQNGVDALDIDWSGANSPQTARDEAKTRSSTRNNKKIKKEKKATPGPAPRISTRSSGATAAAEATVSKASSLGKRSRKVSENTRIPREVRRLQDTAEFAGHESKPVLHTIWSNGKYIDPNDLDENGDPINSKRDRGHTSEAQPEAEEVPEPPKEETPTVVPRQRRSKKWLDKGLYAGQPAPLDRTTGLSAAEKKKLAQLPELKPSEKANKSLPLPMFAGLRLLINGRDFKLPFDVCNPLPPGQPKPDEWRKMTKSKEYFQSDIVACALMNRTRSFHR